MRRSVEGLREEPIDRSVDRENELARRGIPRSHPLYASSNAGEEELHVVVKIQLAVRFE